VIFATDSRRVERRMRLTGSVWLGPVQEEARCPPCNGRALERTLRRDASFRRGRWNTLINVQLVQERQGVIERLEQVLVVFDHLAAHIDPKPLLVHVQLIAIEHVS
jgi:hypothetical protein